MDKIPRLLLRINGVPVSKLSVRKPVGSLRKQIVVTDFRVCDGEGDFYPLGPFPIDERDLVEVQMVNPPENYWKVVSISELLSLFQAAGAIK